MNRHLKRLAVNVDIALGQWFASRYVAYRAATPFDEGRGPLVSAHDWTVARERGYDGAAPSGDEVYFARAFGPERRKLISGWRLADWIAGQPGVRSVLEVGCGTMIASWAISARLPELRYVASDFDPLVIERMNTVRALDHLEKVRLDIDSIDGSDLEAFDLVIGWDVFYAFTPERFGAFLRKIAETRAQLMMCSSQIAGPLRSLSFHWKSTAAGYAERTARGELRDHGYWHTVRTYDLMAQEVGLRCRLVDLPPCDPRSGDTYAFLRFGRGEAQHVLSEPDGTTG